MKCIANNYRTGLRPEVVASKTTTKAIREGIALLDLGALRVAEPKGRRMASKRVG
jgi:hypothetical protein